MSGGSHNYISYTIEEILCGRMYDQELNDLMQDIAELAHDLEWMDSGDISPDTYWETVRKFKKKWFKGNREERLRKYVDTEIMNLKEEMYKMIGVEE